MPRDNLDGFTYDRRMSVRPPLRSRPVKNAETITSLIVVAATLLDTDMRGGVFTLEQLLKKMRELLKPGRTLAVDDVRAKTTQFDKAEPDALDKVFGRGRHAAA